MAESASRAAAGSITHRHIMGVEHRSASTTGMSG